MFNLRVLPKPFLKGFRWHSTEKSQIDYAGEFLLKTAANRVRNIGIIAHVDAGKTTTTERILFYAGVTRRIGDVDEGDTVTDFLAAERERGVTIQSAAVTVPWNGTKVNVVDTPGHADFGFEVVRSLRVVDGAVVVLDAVAGVEPQTERVWQQGNRLPSIIYVNKMDRDGAGFGRTVLEVVGSLRVKAALVNIPYFKNGVFKGVVDVINQKVLVWNESDPDGKTIDVLDPEVVDVAEEAQESRASLVDLLSEYSDEIVEEFLEYEDPMKVPVHLIKKALREATIKSQVVPVICGASFKNIGVQPLMDSIVDYLPSPMDKLPPLVTSQQKLKKKAATQQIKLTSTMDEKLGSVVINKNKNLTAALAFKVVNHPIKGLMTYVRVYSGKLSPNSSLVNSTTGEKIKIGKLLVMNGETPVDVKYLSAGNIGVITGCDEISTGDTLVGHAMAKTINQLSPLEINMKLLPITVPPPVFSVSIEPNTVADRRKLMTSLEMMLKEDPSLKLHFDEETNQLVLSGMGELHLEITRDRLVNDLKVSAEIGDVRVTYKETITSPTEKVNLKSDDGFGVTLSLIPFENDIQEVLEFEEYDQEQVYNLDEDNSLIFGLNAIPESISKALELDQWPTTIPYEKIVQSIVSGTNGGLQIAGKVARLPLHSLVVKIESWTLPPLNDLTTVAPLIQLTRQAIIKAIADLKDSHCTLLEPIMNVKVYVLNSDVGVVSQDLMGARHANIQGINTSDSMEDDNSEVFAGQDLVKNTYVPHDETMKYIKSDDGQQKMVILAEAPLRGMVGYLSKLRSLTKGRGGVDMEVIGMKRCTKDSVKDILG